MAHLLIAYGTPKWGPSRRQNHQAKATKDENNMVSVGGTTAYDILEFRSTNKIYYDYDCISHASLHTQTQSLPRVVFGTPSLDILPNAIVSFVFRLFIKYTVNDI